MTDKCYGYSVLLHPLIQIFLNLAFKRAKESLIIRIIFTLINIFFVTYLGIHYVELTSCSLKTNDYENCFTNKSETVPSTNVGVGDRSWVLLAWISRYLGKLDSAIYSLNLGRYLII